MSLTSHGLSALDYNQPTSWIIDFGAIDHMTFSSKSLSPYTPCSSSRKIIIANGSSIIVTKIGDIHLSPSLTLKNPLHVPKLTTNLISVQHLINDSNCSLTFLSNYYVFQDQDSGEDNWAC